MARLTCLRGHQWESAADPGRSRDTQQLCPVCGGAPVAQAVPDRGDRTLAAPATLPQGVAVLAPAAARPTVAGYEVLGELGRGGMGVVYKARHLTLKRLVALKMALAGAQAGAAELARFKAEAEAVARLQHPNIVQIYEVGEHDGRPFCALEYVAGGSLAQLLAGKPLPAGDAARLVAALADGLQHAHEHGIIHRDLKPAHVLLQRSEAGGRRSEDTLPGGAPDLRPPAPDLFPKVTDFGLAKQLDNPTGPTKSGTVLGTPSYMAPEQAMGRNDAVGPATDVWALGAILYECLTGRPPFRAETSLDTMLQVATVEPTPPARLNPQVPRDLETICLKCLRKEPAKRYASARELGEDLRRFLGGEAIRARPVGVVERAVKWARRRPALLGAAALLVLVPLLAGVVVWRVRDTRPPEAAGGGPVRPPSEPAPRSDYALLIARADQECLASNFHRAGEILDECPAAQRGWEWDYLRRLCHWGVRRTLTGFRGGVRQVAFGKDRRLAVIAVDSAGVQVWDAATGRRLLTLGEQSGKVRAAAFSPDGVRLAAAGEDGELRVYDVDSGKELYHRPHDAPLYCVAFSPKGDVIAAGGGRPEKAGELRLFKAETGEPLSEVRGLKGQIDSLAFDAGGSWVNAGGIKDGIVSFSVPRGQLLDEFPGSQGKYRRVLFMPEAKHIAALSVQANLPAIVTGKVPVAGWVMEYIDFPEGGAGLNLNGQAMTSPDARPGGLVLDAALSADGKVAAMAGGWPTQGKVRFWRGTDRKDSVTLLGHALPVTSVAFAPEGDAAATGSGDGTVVLWDPTVRRYYTPLDGRQAVSLPPLGLAFSPDGRFLATLDEDAAVAVAVWDLDTGRKVACPRQGAPPPRSVSARTAGGWRASAATATGTSSSGTRRPGSASAAFPTARSAWATSRRARAASASPPPCPRRGTISPTSSPRAFSSSTP